MVFHEKWLVQCTAQRTAQETTIPLRYVLEPGLTINRLLKRGVPKDRGLIKLIFYCLWILLWLVMYLCGRVLIQHGWRPWVQFLASLKRKKGITYLKLAFFLYLPVQCVAVKIQLQLVMSMLLSRFAVLPIVSFA